MRFSILFKPVSGITKESNGNPDVENIYVYHKTCAFMKIVKTETLLAKILSHISLFEWKKWIKR